MADEDDDIRDVFASLKALDQKEAPAFSVAEGGGMTVSWPGVAMAACGAAAAITLLCFAIFSEDDRGSIPEPQVATLPVQFEEYSNTVSQHLFADSSDNWHSPTDFLLDYERTLTKP
ncbi:MAG: hypothetical protein ACR2RV_26675 [Verrucomicrobiales bacterium]